VILATLGLVSFVLAILTSYPYSPTFIQEGPDFVEFFPAKTLASLVFGVISVVLLVASLIMIFKRLPVLKGNQSPSHLLDTTELTHKKSLIHSHYISGNHLNSGE